MFNLMIMPLVGPHSGLIARIISLVKERWNIVYHR